MSDKNNQIEVTPQQQPQTKNEKESSEISPAELETVVGGGIMANHNQNF